MCLFQFANLYMLYILYAHTYMYIIFIGIISYCFCLFKTISYYTNIYFFFFWYFSYICFCIFSHYFTYWNISLQFENNRYVWQLELNWIYCLVSIYFQPFSRTSDNLYEQHPQTTDRMKESFLIVVVVAVFIPTFFLLIVFLVNKATTHGSVCVSEICCWLLLFIIVFVVASDAVTFIRLPS